MEVRENEPLSRWTTLGVGGDAARFVTCETDAEICEEIAHADADRTPVLVLGGGSNLVVGARFAGSVLHVATRGVTISADGERALAVVAAGESWDGFVERAVAEGLAGVECLSGVPGLVGATPIQNVGAYGQDVSRTIACVRAWDRDAGAEVTLSNAACGFGYRASVMKRSSRWVVLSVTFRLPLARVAPVPAYAELQRALPEAEAPLTTLRSTVLALRAKKGMVLSPSDPDTRSCGSFFMNPIVAASVRDRLRGEHPTLPAWDEAAGDDGAPRAKLAAGWLIEQAGFRKGETRGAVALSSKHALALVNCGGATGADVVAFAREIRDAVAARFGVTLVPEPDFVALDW